ncbi:hypothetical protein GZ77_06060 [Endozoicomonas montiporae]|uniref:ATPase AAA n=2 Tax=Endozoicomonas montiporae TaxID=1027273 RepID=A0A081NC55_9GAMM|nr:hypothetical protein GZ77_06060 [Endozoicomonas montiporae]
MSDKEVLVVGIDECADASLLSATVADGWKVSFTDEPDLNDINAQGRPDVAILSVSPSGCSRLVLNQFMKRLPGVAVIVISPVADRQQAVELISAGAADYLVSPVDPEVLASKINQLRSIAGADGFIAHSPSTHHTAQLARRAAVTNAAILVGGESGTGKEVLARFVHGSSHRTAGPFVAVNCAAIPESMLESILFGHEKGAFTGAVSRHAGKFEQASGGTLFLDEVAEMPLEQQAKLLRVLQEKEVERLGGTEPVKVDIRVISATNRDLAECVKEGRFREDLYYRLNVFPLHLQPLRERVEDILPLAQFFLHRSSGQTGQPAPELSPEAVSALQTYHWPGNIRELENVIQRACVLKRSWVVLPEDLMLPGQSVVSRKTDVANVVGISDWQSGDQSENSSDPDRVVLESYPGPARKHQEWRHVLEVLKRHGGHRSRSAEELGMTTRMLRYKLAQLRESGIDVDSIIAGSVMAS